MHASANGMEDRPRCNPSSRGTTLTQYGHAVFLRFVASRCACRCTVVVHVVVHVAVHVSAHVVTCGCSCRRTCRCACRRACVHDVPTAAFVHAPACVHTPIAAALISWAHCAHSRPATNCSSLFTHLCASLYTWATAGGESEQWCRVSAAPKVSSLYC